MPVSDGAYRFVETLFHNGITAGCGGGKYCPTSNVTRWQMAVFLATSLARTRRAGSGVGHRPLGRLLQLHQRRQLAVRRRRAHQT